MVSDHFLHLLVHNLRVILGQQLLLLGMVVIGAVVLLRVTALWTVDVPTFALGLH